MKRIYILFTLMAISGAAFSQIDIHALMRRTDLKLSQIDSIAQLHFAAVGTARGSGYNQYQRWYYEQRFHLTEDGYIRPKAEEMTAFEQAMQTMRSPSTAGTWVPTGPTTWNRTSGWNPGVGRITCIAISPLDTTVIYVGSPGGGLWKSTNSGSTWSPLSDNAANRMDITAVSVDPLNVNVVYLASSSGYFKSTDGGATWLIMPTIAGTVRKYVVQPGNSNIVFAASTSGIYRSINAGSAWTRVSTASTEDIEFRPTDVNTMFASGSTAGSNVQRSADNGVTWTAVGSAAGITNSGRTLISVTPADPNVVYVVQANGSLFGRMYRSNDAGLTFTTTVVGSPGGGTNYFGYDTNGTGTSGQATYDMAMCVSPFDANEVHIGGIICFMSINGGLSFTATTAWSLPNSIGYNHADVHTLEWINNTIYSSSDGGVYKSTDRADNWTDLTTGLDIRQFYRIDCSQTDFNIYGGGAQDNGSSIHRSTGWIDWLGADGMEMEFSYTNANVVYGTSQNGQLYRSTNGGTSYTSLPQSSTGQWVTPFAVHPTRDSIVFVGWTGVYKTVNRGNSWTNISSGSIGTTLACLTISMSNPDYIYASNGTVMYRTTDGGGTWSPAFAPATITSILVHPTNPLKIWITTSTSGAARVMESIDGGNNFTSIAGSLPAVAGRTIVIDRDDPKEGMYVGMNTGVYYKDNTMSDWIPFLNGLPLVAVNELDIQQSARKIRVGTYGRGIWETDLSTTIPVRWISFTGKRGNNGNLLTWKVEENANTDSYDLEYSPNGVRYSVIKTITAQSKLQNSNGLTASYTEADTAKNDAYYRLRQYDKDGRSTYSEVVFLKGGQKKALVLYPNPVKDQLRISIPGVLGNNPAIVQVYKINGIMLLQQTINGNTATINTDRFSSGQYVVRVTVGNTVYQQVFSKAE